MKPQCLYCFATLETDSIDCAACGKKSLKSDRRIYWNRSPKLLALQKVITSISLVATILIAFSVVSAGTGPGGGWLIALPITMHMAVSQTAAKLTKHAPYFNAAVFWPMLFIVGGVFLALVVSPCAIPLCLFAYPAFHTCKAAEEWKRSIRNGPQTR